VCSTFATFEDTDNFIKFKERESKGKKTISDHEYSRYTNPTTDAAERKIAILDRAEESALFSSGMNAITTTLLSEVSNGDKNSHFIFSSDLYTKTREFVDRFLTKTELELTIASHDEICNLNSIIRENTSLLFIESPANPLLRIHDLGKISKICKAKGIKVIVDSTFASPENYSPLEYGADLTIASASKYIGGHNDLLAGSVSGNHELISQLRITRGILGGICAPDIAARILRGLETIKIRVHKQNETGLNVARYLEKHKKVRKVWYPGLESHPDYQIARDKFHGFGGVVPFEIDADLDLTSRFIDALQIPVIAPSFGGSEALVSQTSLISFYGASEEKKKAFGISDSLVRFVVGLHDSEELISDLERAFKVIFA